MARNRQSPALGSILVWEDRLLPIMWLATWIWISLSFSKVIWHLIHWYVFFCLGTREGLRLSRDRKPRPQSLAEAAHGGLASPQASQSTLRPPGHRLPSKGLLPCWNWNNPAVCQGQLSQEPRRFVLCIHLSICKYPALPVLVQWTPYRLLHKRDILPTDEIWESAWILRVLAWLME